MVVRSLNEVGAVEASSTRAGEMLLRLLLLILIAIPQVASQSVYAEEEWTPPIGNTAMVVKVGTLDKTLKTASFDVIVQARDLDEAAAMRSLMLASLSSIRGPVQEGELLTCYWDRPIHMKWKRRKVDKGAEEETDRAVAELRKPDADTLRKYLPHLESPTVIGDLIYVQLKRLAVAELAGLKAEDYFETAVQNVSREKCPFDLFETYYFLIAGCGERGSRYLIQSVDLATLDGGRPYSLGAARIFVGGDRQVVEITDRVFSPKSPIKFGFPYLMVFNEYLLSGNAKRDLVLENIARYCDDLESADHAIGILYRERAWEYADTVMNTARKVAKAGGRPGAVTRAAIRFFLGMERAHAADDPESRQRRAGARERLAEMKKLDPQNYEDVLEFFDEVERLMAP